MVFQLHSRGVFHDFPDREWVVGAQTQTVGVSNYYLTSFSGKLHENEEKYAESGVQGRLYPPLKNFGWCELFIVRDFIR